MAGQEESRGLVGWGSGRVHVGVGGWGGVKWCGAGLGGFGVGFGVWVG